MSTRLGVTAVAGVVAVIGASLALLGVVAWGARQVLRIEVTE